MRKVLSNLVETAYNKVNRVVDKYHEEEIWLTPIVCMQTLDTMKGFGKEQTYESYVQNTEIPGHFIFVVLDEVPSS